MPSFSPETWALGVFLSPCHYSPLPIPQATRHPPLTSDVPSLPPPHPTSDAPSSSLLMWVLLSRSPAPKWWHNTQKRCIWGCVWVGFELGHCLLVQVDKDEYLHWQYILMQVDKEAVPFHRYKFKLKEFENSSSQCLTLRVILFSYN